MSRPGRSRNPNWVRDELILALDLYKRLDFTNTSGQYGETSLAIQELSEVLNALPLHPWRPDSARFRNGNGVYMKLCNFLRVDPEYHGKGLDAGNQLEEVVWNEFVGDLSRLSTVADGIRVGAEIVRNSERNGFLMEDEFPEGQILTRLHLLRERNRSAVKTAVTKKADTGPLKCGICAFDFSARYGRLGSDFIECHDVQPLSRISANPKPDLVLVCSNCHRMAHRARPWLGRGELLSIVL
jgi:5-methylcytosine-specific restriction protein A